MHSGTLSTRGIVNEQAWDGWARSSTSGTVLAGDRRVRHLPDRRGRGDQPPAVRPRRGRAGARRRVPHRVHRHPLRDLLPRRVHEPDHDVGDRGHAVPRRPVRARASASSPPTARSTSGSCRSSGSSLKLLVAAVRHGVAARVAAPPALRPAHGPRLEVPHRARVPLGHGLGGDHHRPRGGLEPSGSSSRAAVASARSLVLRRALRLCMPKRDEPTSHESEVSLMGRFSGFGGHARQIFKPPVTERATRRRSGRSRRASTAVTSSTATRTAWRSASAASCAPACARRAASTCAAPTTRPTRRSRRASGTGSSTRSTTCAASTATCASRRARPRRSPRRSSSSSRSPTATDAIYTKDELLVDDDGRARRQPWELWLGGEDDDTSAWMRATVAVRRGRVRGPGRLVGRARLRRAADPEQGQTAGDDAATDDGHDAPTRSSIFFIFAAVGARRARSASCSARNPVHAALLLVIDAGQRSRCSSCSRTRSSSPRCRSSSTPARSSCSSCS